jgi:hypothetical protein
VSQPCSAVELVLIDANALLNESAEARDALVNVRQRGVPTAAIADLPDLAHRLDAAGFGDAFDFWTPGSPGVWPLERVLALTTVEPGRILFLSDDPLATSQAVALGLRVCRLAAAELERVLP